MAAVACLLAFAGCSGIDPQDAETSTAPQEPATQPTAPASSSAPETNTPETSTPETSTSETVPVASTTESVPVTEATTTSTTPQLRTVSPDSKLRGWVGGDSLPAYIVTWLRGGSADLDLLDLTWNPQISSSIVRPSFVDWSNDLAALLDSPEAPEALIFMIGGNDNQGMTDDNGTNLPRLTPEWQVEYRKRVANLMDLTNRPETQMLWVGLPPGRDGVRLELNQTVNAIFSDEASLRPWVTYLDIGPLFSNPDGTYAESLVGPDGGDPVVARSSDGVHITYAASRWIADLAWSWMSSTWRLQDPSEPSPDQSSTTLP